MLEIKKKKASKVNRLIRLNSTEERTNDPEDGAIEITQNELHEGGKKELKDIRMLHLRLIDLSVCLSICLSTSVHPSIHQSIHPQGEKRERKQTDSDWGFLKKWLIRLWKPE